MLSSDLANLVHTFRNTSNYEHGREALYFALKECRKMATELMVRC